MILPLPVEPTLTSRLKMFVVPAGIVAVPSLLMNALSMNPGKPADQFDAANQSPVGAIQLVSAPQAKPAVNVRKAAAAYARPWSEMYARRRRFPCMESP